jgi:hypothetical protein
VATERMQVLAVGKLSLRPRRRSFGLQSVPLSPEINLCHGYSERHDLSQGSPVMSTFLPKEIDPVRLPDLLA